MKNLVDELREVCAKNLITSNKKVVALHQSRHKLLVRDRIDKLLDNGSAFLELSQFAGYRVYGEDELPAAGIVTGIGQVAGLALKLIIITNVQYQILQRVDRFMISVPNA